MEGLGAFGTLLLTLEDVKLVVDTGLEAFRTSISWSRLIPNGRGPVNAKGLQYYNNLINELISNGRTLWSLLMCALRNSVTTLNEVNVAAIGGYDAGTIAPGRCLQRSICAQGDSTTEPYTVVHNMLLAHSAAAKLYTEKYKATQNGKLGLNIYMFGSVPYTNSTEKVMAAQRANDFYVGWVMNPLILGDYPDIVKKCVQARIPAFTKHESEQMNGSLNFIGVNYYFIALMKDDPSMRRNVKDFYADMAVDIIYDSGGVPADHYRSMPWGLKGVLEYLKQEYGNPPIYIQENGQKSRRNGILNATFRVDYMQAYIGAALDAVRNGSNTKGYFQWAFLDCLELLDGYESSFGLYYVDLDDEDLRRYQKLSARWYSNFLKGKNTRPNAVTQVRENASISLR